MLRNVLYAYNQLSQLHYFAIVKSDCSFTIRSMNNPNIFIIDCSGVTLTIFADFFYHIRMKTKKFY